MNNIKKGFSIAEVCVVCGIMAVLLIPIFTIMSKSNTGTIRNRNEVLAQQSVSNILNRLCMQKFKSVELEATAERQITDLMKKITIAGKEIDLIDESFDKIATFTYSVTEFPESPTWPNAYKVVTVYVNWQQLGNNPKRNMKMSGVVADNWYQPGNAKIK